jgi:hypothetical protein
MNSRLALLLTAGALAVSAAPAAAATTLGQIAPAGAGGLGGCTNCSSFQTQTAPGSAEYVVPAGGGVITSWMFRAASTATSAKLRLFAPGPGAGQYTLMAESLSRAFSLGQTGTTATQIPVTAGMHLGVAVTAGDQQWYTYNNLDTISSGLDWFGPLGKSVLAVDTSQRHVNIAATLEPDADHDGYGDETQDGCPWDPTKQSSCGQPPLQPAPHQPLPPAPSTPSSPATPTPPDGGKAGGQSTAVTVQAGPLVSLVAPGRESITSGYVTLAAMSVGQVDVSAGGQVSGRALGSAKATIAAGKRVTLKLRIPRKTLHLIRVRLARHKKVSAKLTVTAGGTTTSVRVRLVR